MEISEKCEKLRCEKLENPRKKRTLPSEWNANIENKQLARYAKIDRCQKMNAYVGYPLKKYY
jgi:hypothetical protein